MKKYSLLLVALLIASLAGAQNSNSTTSSSSFYVKGILIDSLTHEGEPYATVKITKKETPTKAVKMFVTGQKGEFRERVNGSGTFVITISSVGRKDVVRTFSAKPDSKEIDLGTLNIADASNELGEVNIVAQKPLVKADIDKIEYNVQDDPDAQTNSVLEMLRKVPLVTVDGEDNIQVNGSSNFKVYVNGKPNNMMSNNPTEVLKSMPANSIKHIEVITNPGPKYDAEGVGGILNIVTVGSGLEGYTATFSANASTTGAGGGLFGTVKSGKFTMSGRYYYNQRYGPRSYSGGSQHLESAEITKDVVSTNNSKGDGSYQSGSLEASYEIDTLRLVSMSFGLWGGNNSSKSAGESVTTSLEHGGYGYLTNSRNKSSWYSIDGGIDYQRLSRTVKDRMFTLSYKINTRPQNSDGSYVYDKGTDYDPFWDTEILALINQRTDGSQNTTEQTFQADYTTPIGKIHTVEAGAKYIMRDNKSENDLYKQPDGSPEALDEQRSSHYKHQNDILAAYAGYSLRVKKISGRAGLRYEHTIQDVEYLRGPGADFKKNFDDFVPSVSLGYKLTDMSNLRLGYNLRIYRPGIYFLNPYINDSNPMNIQQGNPELNNEKSHAFNLSYSNFTQKFNINFSLRYSFVNNSIESVTTMVDDNDIPGLQNPTGRSDVLYTTYQNIGKTRNLNLSGYVNWNASPNTRIYLNLYGGYTSLKGGNGLQNHGWSVFAYGGAQQSFKHDWRLSLNVMGQTPWVTLQGKSNSFYDYNLSVNKSFLKKRLTLSAFAGNFLTKYTRSESNMSGPGFSIENWYKQPRRRFGVSVSYRIGELKAGVKKAERSISNDDVKGSGGGEGGEN
ncbi:MAG: TonB-dependent receptor [Mediterranea sp.]|jgi:outer membrane receptor protein involved in Fe transport|nr:TonB-dependent receptor [Mediterranea sp.]